MKNLRHYKKNLHYIYGPVFSWRLGNSLGIDPISSGRKICTFDCIYCQLGLTSSFSEKRKIYVKTEKIIEEVKSLPKLKLDYITFSGRGEPTLAKNLGELIRAVKKIRKEKIAVLTNSSLINRKEVRKDLALAGFVIAKLDAPSQGFFDIINRPIRNIKLRDIVEGLKKFRKEYKGKLALRIMFIDYDNGNIKGLLSLVNYIKPDEIQINTPLRPCAVKPLSKKELFKIKRHFWSMPGFKGDVFSVYECRRKKVTPISSNEAMKRRGKR